MVGEIADQLKLHFMHEMAAQRSHVQHVLQRVCGSYRLIHVQEKWFRKYLNRKLGSKCVVSGTNIDSLCGVLIQSTSSHPHLHSTWEPVLREVRKEGIFQLFWKTVVDGESSIWTL